MLTILFTLGFAASAAVAEAPSELRGEALIAALQSGGYTIMLRHARTDRTVNEGPSYASLTRAQQRNLNDDGVRDAKLIGLVMKRYAIPVGEILSSQMYRTRETAEYAFGEPTPYAELQQLAESPAQRALVMAAPKPGTNRVIVTHHFIIERYAPGITPGEIAESEAAVVRPNGEGGLTLVGRFTRADWQGLAPPERTETAPAPATGGPAPELPSTRVGKLASGYLHSFNTGDPAVMRHFIESSFVTDPKRPMDARLETYQKLFEELGSLAVVSIQSAADDAVELTARSKKGEVRVSVKTAPDQPERVGSVRFTYGDPNRIH